MRENMRIEDFNNIIKVIKCPIIVVYKNPLDFPNKFVARLFNMLEPTKYMTIADNLLEIRNTIPSYLYKMGRQEDDDIAIYETYV